MRKIGRILKISLLIFIITTFYCMSFADVWDTALEVVKKKSDDKYFADGQGKMTHEITSCDRKKGEIKLRLTLTNTSEGSKEEPKAPTEIYIILDENLVTDAGNYSNFCSYIETLAEKVYAKSSKAKIGIIGMKGPKYDWVSSDGGYKPVEGSDEGEKDGTAQDSEVVIKATNNIDELKNALQTMNSSKQRYYPNLQSALITAENTFEKESNKILISLYDNVPQVSVGTHDQIKLEVGEGAEEAREKVIDRNTQLVTNTKKEILNLKSNNINFILLKPADSSFDQNWYSYTTGEVILTYDGSDNVRDLYGTLENPTYGKMYSLEYNSLQKIITENIYADIVATISGIMNHIKVREYLTQEIMDNFTFTIDDDDEDVDVSNLASSRYFVWNIEKLAPDEVAVLNYTLRIKDMQNTAIFDKILSINEKIDVMYEDGTGQEKKETELTSPQVKLTGKRIENNTNTNTNTNTNRNPNNAPNTNNTPINTPDNTTAPKDLPKTGSKVVIAVSLGMMLITGFVLYVKYRNLDDVQ